MLYVLVVLIIIVLLIFIDTTIWFPDVSHLMYIEDCPDDSPQSSSGEPVLTPTASAVAADISVNCVPQDVREPVEVTNASEVEYADSVDVSLQDVDDIPTIDVQDFYEMPDVNMFAEVDLDLDSEEQECTKGASAFYGGGAQSVDVQQLLDKLKQQVGNEVYATV